MSFKPIIKSEIELNETPVTFQNVVNERLERDKVCKLIKVMKQIEYPYLDETEMVVFKAYLASFNLMTLVGQYGFSERVSVDSMVIGDFREFLEYWETHG